jgi:hypothetical protein
VNHPRRLALLPLLAAGSLLIAACGDDNTQQPATPPTTDAMTETTTAMMTETTTAMMTETTTAMMTDTTGG